MRKIYYIVLIATIALFSNCNTNDDGFYNNVYVNIPNLVSINAHPTTYSIGEKLYINANFSRYLDENGKTLDIYKTTGATEFSFSYVIEKQVDASTWQVVSVNDNQLDIIKGTAQNGAYVYGICEYNTSNETYEYRVGFPLLSAGTYRLSFGYNSDSGDKVELRSLSPATQLILNINSLIAGVNTNGFYNFTVN
jgi:hypothetical protein